MAMKLWSLVFLMTTMQSLTWMKSANCLFLPNIYVFDSYLKRLTVLTYPREIVNWHDKSKEPFAFMHILQAGVGCTCAMNAMQYREYSTPWQMLLQSLLYKCDVSFCVIYELPRSISISQQNNHDDTGHICTFRLHFQKQNVHGKDPSLAIKDTTTYACSNTLLCCEVFEKWCFLGSYS